MATKAPEVILVDTNVLIDYLDEVPEIVIELDALATKRLAISIVTELGILYGMFRKEERRTKEFLNKFERIHLDKETGMKAVELMWGYSNRPKLPDCFIAATALCNNVRLFTLNRKDFDYIKGLKLYRPRYRKT